MPEEFTFRPMEATEEDLALFKGCFDDNGSGRELEHLRWQYLESPGEKLLVDFAFGQSVETGEQVLAGIYAVFPIPMSVNGRPVLGTQSLDTMTDARFRRKGLFGTLAKNLSERLPREGVDLVYGFPNGNSAHGFFKRLSWTNLDPVPFLIRPIQASYAIRRLGRLGRALAPWLKITFPIRRPKAPGLDFEEVGEFDEEFDRLWDQNAQEFGIALTRNSKYLNWRIRNNPRFKYVTIAARRNGVLVGYVTYRVADKHGGRLGYVMELLHRPGAVREGKALMGQALAAMAEDEAEVVLAWNLGHSPTHPLFRNAGFFPLPERLKPIELHFGARGFRGEYAGMVGDRSGWYLSYLDSDTV